MPDTIAADSVASTEWARVVELLGHQLTPADVGILASYCGAFAFLTHARKQLGPGDPSQGWDFLVTNADGTAKKLNPLVNLVNTAQRDLVKFAEALGMAPPARARLMGLADRGPEDPLDEFLAS